MGLQWDDQHRCGGRGGPKMTSQLWLAVARSENSAARPAETRADPDETLTRISTEWNPSGEIVLPLDPCLNPGRREDCQEQTRRDRHGPGQGADTDASIAEPLLSSRWLGRIGCAQLHGSASR